MSRLEYCLFHSSRLKADFGRSSRGFFCLGSAGTSGSSSSSDLGLAALGALGALGAASAFGFSAFSALGLDGGLGGASVRVVLLGSKISTSLGWLMMLM